MNMCINTPSLWDSKYYRPQLKAVFGNRTNYLRFEAITLEMRRRIFEQSI